ncbi:MAG: hypothetical protein CL859_01285 [Cyanobium sp. ARS6]|nr:hypothetical protein [Cyanobium sp. ARS6]
MAESGFCCELCGRFGSVHFRVRSEATTQWTLVCADCWTGIAAQPGYRYGGTRKANRRNRKR